MKSRHINSFLLFSKAPKPELLVSFWLEISTIFVLYFFSSEMVRTAPRRTAGPSYRTVPRPTAEIKKPGCEKLFEELKTESKSIKNSLDRLKARKLEDDNDVKKRFKDLEDKRTKMREENISLRSESKRGED